MRTEDARREIGPHPCFESSHSREVTRIHLPVAASCNIRCSYCNPREDCVHESGPGAASAVIPSGEALQRVKALAAGERPLGVIGVAGPGDPLANEATFETLAVVGRWAAESGSRAALCVSTNGMALASAVPRLVELGVSHLTVTVNAVDPRVGERLLLSATTTGGAGGRGLRLKGVAASKALIEAQSAGIRAAVLAGITVKVNTVLVPEINGGHIAKIAETVAGLGAVRMNVMPLIPRAALRFMAAPTPDELETARAHALRRLPVMRHCGQCRADASGLLSAPSSACGVPVDVAATADPADHSIRVAVATGGSGLVDRHFGHVESFEIWQATPDPTSANGWKVEQRETRAVEQYCQGAEECASDDDPPAIAAVSDCALLICTRIGHGPQKRLNSNGVVAREIYGPISSAVLNAVSAFSSDTGLRRTAEMLERRSKPGTYGRLGRIKADAS